MRHGKNGSMSTVAALILGAAAVAGAAAAACGGSTAGAPSGSDDGGKMDSGPPTSVDSGGPQVDSGALVDSGGPTSDTADVETADCYSPNECVYCSSISKWQCGSLSLATCPPGAIAQGESCDAGMGFHCFECGDAGQGTQWQCTGPVSIWTMLGDYQCSQ